MSRASIDDGVLPSLMALIGRIGPLDTQAQAEAAARLDQLTKPRGSLGRLEELAVTLAGITGVPAPTFARKAVVIFAADHGVTAQGVSAYPSEVTAAMVANFLTGGAAIDVLAADVGAELVVVDVGVASRIPEASTSSAGVPPARSAGVPSRLIRSPVRAGTRDLSVGPALERSETLAALEVGLKLADELRREGVTIVAVGEMGIGNTTAASAIVAVLTGADARSVTGRGTGVDDATLERKVAAVERGRARLGRAPLGPAPLGPAPADPLRVLDEVGGLEIAALCGFILGAAAARIPVVLDGFITGAAALLAARICPALPPRLIAAHRSAEPGHAAALDALGLDPLLDLRLRLGEASGATLALTLVDASCGLRDRMATFKAAAVPGPVPS